MPRRAARVHIIASFSYSLVFRGNFIIPTDFLAHFGDFIFVDDFRRVRDINNAFGVALRYAVLRGHFYIHRVDVRTFVYANTALLVVDNHLADRICYIFAHLNIIYQRVCEGCFFTFGGQRVIVFSVRVWLHRNGTLPRIIIRN